MNKNKEQFYLVDLKILPEAIKKTIRVKEMLENGTCTSINEAVHKAGMSRSAYYKYKDHVAPAHSDKEDRIVVLFIIMQDEISIFSRILRRIGRERLPDFSKPWNFFPRFGKRAESTGRGRRGTSCQTSTYSKSGPAQAIQLLRCVSGL